MSDGKLELCIIDPQLLDLCWQRVEPLLRRSCEHSPEYTVEQMRLGILSGQYQLHVARQGDDLAGVAAVQVIQYPQFKSAHIAAMAGRDLVGHPTLRAAFYANLKAQGCTKIQFVARPSAARLYRRMGLSSDLTFVRSEI